MKSIIFGVSTFITLLVVMYYRKQRIKKHKITIEEMKRPQLNVVPENVTSHLIETLEQLSKTFETKMEPEIRKYRLLLDSGERNTTTYPLVTDYQLQLPETIYGMEKISLQKAVFPMSLELINSNNNQITFSVTWTAGGSTTTSYPLTLTPGNYTISSLGVMLQTALNAAMVADSDQTTPATWEVSIDSDTLLITIKILTLPTLTSLGGAATSATFSIATTNSYLLAILGITSTSPSGTDTVPLVGNEPVNVAYPYNLLIYLDNRSFDFNSLRIMKSSEIDDRCFANFNMPSGNSVCGGMGVPSTGTVSGAPILVQGSSGASGFGTYIISKDMTNAYYRAYEGPIPSVRFINVRIRQLLPNGSVVVPDFNNSNHSMEFEMKAKVDKISAKLV
jgi:hypothetical protein